MDTHSRAPSGSVAHELFEAYPAPTFIVDDDVRLLRMNRAARSLLGDAGDAAPLLLTRSGEALHCVNASGAGGCGRQDACSECVIRGSVEQALARRAVHRARAFMQVRNGAGDTDVCVLVSASPLVEDGALRAVLTLENVGDVHLKGEVLRAERALRESEQRVRAKLDAILAPEGDVSTLELGDVLDAEPLRVMLEEFNRLTRIPMAIIDARGEVLVGVGWQDICTRFHRVHPDTCRHCLESDTELSAGVRPGEIRRYRCKNGMWDVATPIMVGDHHAGNVFMGQFFFTDEPVDHDLFRAQAARYGFDEEEYLAALERVPRLDRDAIAAAMGFFLKFAGMLSRSSYGQLKLARSAAEREALMASLRESKDRLEETDRRKDEFLAVLSHELRNPLAPIRSSLYLLDRAAPGSREAARARAVIDRQVKQLSRLVDDLLDVTRISHGKISLARERVDLREVVRRTCDDGRSAFDEREIELHLDLPFGPVWVDADPTRVSQAVGNLVHNAAKFTPRGGRVVASVAVRDGRAQIAVADDGVGLDPGDLERIFQPFAQAEQGLARTHGGLGLGLALVKALVELHGGSAEARSDGPGRGAEFVIRLPLADAAAPAAGEAGTGAAARPLVVLVVEDNLDAGESLVDVLELHGHRVRLATDGRSGLRLARELRPDVVVCDVGLPDLDGYEVARAIRADADLRATRLVALTGYALHEDRQRTRAAGFDAHVAKPADVDELLALLDDGA
jgi:signal transduction histidine kinase